MDQKPFDNDLFAENDGVARDKTVELINKVRPSRTVVDNPNQYGPDLLVFEGRKFVIAVEVEVKRVWSGERFPFREIDIPGRKTKFIHRKVCFVVWNKELEHCAYVSSNALSSGRVISKNTIYTENEKFIRVPIESVCFLKIS